MGSITFDRDCIAFILEALCLKVNHAGIVCNKMMRPVPTLSGKTRVHLDNLAGFVNIKKGMRLIESDIFGLMGLSDRIVKGRFRR